MPHLPEESALRLAPAWQQRALVKAHGSGTVSGARTHDQGSGTVSGARTHVDHMTQAQKAAFGKTGTPGYTAGSSPARSSVPTHTAPEDYGPNFPRGADGQNIPDKHPGVQPVISGPGRSDEMAGSGTPPYGLVEAVSTKGVASLREQLLAMA